MVPETRVLPPEEWWRLAAFPPFDEAGLPDHPEHWRLIATLVGEEVVGMCCLFDATHWENWWIREDHRRNPAVLRGLLRESFKTLQAAGIRGVFSVVSTDLPEQQAILERFGFIEAPGKLYLLAVPEPEPAEV